MAPIKKWDGKGSPPTIAAAKAWLRAQGVDSATLDRISTRMSLGDAGRLARGLAKKEGAKKPAAATPKPRATTQPKTPTQPAIDPATGQAIGTIGVGPDGEFQYTPSAESTRGAPLLPFSTSPGEEVLIPNADYQPSGMLGRLYPAPKAPPRYYEADLNRPLNWSKEKKADLQRDLMRLGLYGDAKTELGFWSAADQAAYRYLLTYANGTGRTATDTLTMWLRHGVPPIIKDQIDVAAGGAKQKPAITLTAPADIRAAAGAIAQQVTGGGDVGFLDEAVGAYQAHESATQGAANAVAEAGGGGSVTNTTSAGNFLADKLRREQPLEVNGQSFHRVFDQFLGTLRSPV